MPSAEKTILHIDDDADDRALLKEFIHEIEPGIKIESAENGLDAMKLLEACKEAQYLPCLIILDLNMPYLNGRETFKLIKSDQKLKNIPLVVFSSGENPAEKSLFDQEGITYFTKPIELAAMRSIAGHFSNLCQ